MGGGDNVQMRAEIFYGESYHLQEGSTQVEWQLRSWLSATHSLGRGKAVRNDNEDERERVCDPLLIYG